MAWQVQTFVSTVFISYSRKDGDFVRRLHESLSSQDHQTWVDWEDIPPTGEWMKEIVEAIDATGAFVFVITPDSVASAVCAKELEHAIQQNKRLIPILRRDIEIESSPESLAKLNWIFLRDSDDFAKSMQALVTAIDTDLDWVHAHSRLLVRAREWDSKNREGSMALRGQDLKSAEQWLTLGATRQPAPTELQTRYILESRQTATRRRYQILGAVMVGLMAVAVLATTTYLGRREASKQQTLALAGRLTEDSNLAREQTETVPREVGWLESSVQLATEAARQLNSLGVRSLQTDIAMRRGLTLLPGRSAGLQRGSLGSVEAIAFDGDATLIAATKDAFSIECWNLASQKNIRQTRPAGSVNSVVFSPDGRFFATTELNNIAGAIDIWEVATLERVASFTGIGDKIDGLAISSSGAYLVAAAENYDKGKQTWVDGPTRIWNTADASHSEIARLPHASSIAFSADARWLAAMVDSSPKVWRITSNPDFGLEEINLKLPQSNALTLQFSSDGKELIASFENNRAQIWTVGNWQTAREFPFERTPWAVSPDGRYVATKRDDYTASVFDTSSGDEVGRIHAANLISAVAFRPDSQELAIASLANTIEIWRIAGDASDSTTISAGGEVLEAGFNAANTLTTIVPVANQLMTKNWPVTKSQTYSNFAIRRPRGTLAAVSANGRFMAVASGGTATVLNTADGQTVQEVSYSGKATAIALNPDGGAVAIAIDNGTVLLWQTRAAQQPMRFTFRGSMSQHGLAIGSAGVSLSAVVSEGVSRAGERLVTYSWIPAKSMEAIKTTVGTGRSGLTEDPCALSSDARYVVTNHGNGVMALREITTGAIVASINHPGGNNTCALSADSSLLATAGSGVIRIWEIATRTEIARMEGAADVTGLLFSPDGRYLATLSPHGVIHVKLLRAGDLIDAACGRLTANMTRETWRDYFADIPYRATCRALPLPAH